MHLISLEEFSQRFKKFFSEKFSKRFSCYNFSVKIRLIYERI